MVKANRLAAIQFTDRPRIITDKTDTITPKDKASDARILP